MNFLVKVFKPVFELFKKLFGLF